MNVFVDRTADSVQTIVAVREDAGHRKFLEPAGNGRLQDANIGVVIDPHGIKLDAEVFPIVRLTVGLQDLCRSWFPSARFQGSCQPSPSRCGLLYFS